MAQQLCGREELLVRVILTSVEAQHCISNVAPSLSKVLLYLSLVCTYPC